LALGLIRVVIVYKCHKAGEHCATYNPAADECDDCGDDHWFDFQLEGSGGGLRRHLGVEFDLAGWPLIEQGSEC